MKKLIRLLLALCCVAALVLPVFADVIWEPYDNAFYEAHGEDFQLSGEMCYVNSPTGTADTYDAPGGKKTGSLENGGLFQAYYVYTDEAGDQWAMAETRQEDGSWGTQYVPMDQLLPRYDTQEFLADHPDEVTDAPPQGLSLTLEPEVSFLSWTYPQGVSTEQTYYGLGEDLVKACGSFYTDPVGNTWGHIDYLYGDRDFWICLTDCNDAALAQPELYTGTRYFGPEAAPLEEARPEGSSWLIWGLPVAAAALAGGMLLLWPKRRKEKRA